MSKNSLLVMIAVLALTSCEKAKVLRAERDKLEAERVVLQQEVDHYQNQYRLLMSSGTINIPQMERMAQDTLKQADALALTASTKMNRWQGVESQLKPLKERVDAWKSKYLK